MSDKKGRSRLANTAARPQGDQEFARPTDHEEIIQVTLVLRPAAPQPGQRSAQRYRSVREKPPHHRPALSHEDLEQIFSPDDEHIGRIRTFAREHGLTVVRTSKVQHDMVLEGPVSAMNEAFGVKLRDVGEGERRYRGHHEDISVPESIRDVVVSVIGLNTVPFSRTFVAFCSTPSGPVTPGEVGNHYNFPDADGSGYRIAILCFGQCGYHQSDIDGFFGTGNSPALHDHSVSGTSNNPLPQQTLANMTTWYKNGQPSPDPFTPFEKQWGFDTLEVTMDIQVAGAIAGGAAIDLYFAPDNELGWYNAINQALGFDNPNHPGLPAAISISWGASESDWTENRMNAVKPALEKAQLMHVTVCCSSGNYGSLNQSGGTGTMARVNHPASSPHAFAVGGTMVTCDAATNTPVESVWNQVTPRGHHASGGGVSGYFKIPPYQSSAGVPSHAKLNGAAWLSSLVSPPGWFPLFLWRWFGRRCFRGRGVPDVAAFAALDVGYGIHIGGQSFISGGTSAATPLWAGLIACLSEKLGQRVPWLNELVYQPDFASAFRDIVSGDNRIGTTAAAYFVAGQDWEACCGLGVPDGEALYNCLKTALAAPQAPSGLSAQAGNRAQESAA